MIYAPCRRVDFEVYDGCCEGVVDCPTGMAEGLCDERRAACGSYRRFYSGYIAKL
jgi:hypothetical protein